MLFTQILEFRGFSLSFCACSGQPSPAAGICSEIFLGAAGADTAHTLRAMAVTFSRASIPAMTETKGAAACLAAFLTSLFLCWIHFSCGSFVICYTKQKFSISYNYFPMDIVSLFFSWRRFLIFASFPSFHLQLEVLFQALLQEAQETTSDP